MTIQIDLHTHSTVSDGTLTPYELVNQAIAANVDILALTDHDTTDGWPAACQAAHGQGITLVPGVEISVTWHGQVIHIVGLHIDPQNATLQSGLASLREFRDWRATEIGRRLSKYGIANAYEGAARFAAGSIIGRTHFARFLVEQGICKDVRDVFKRYLVRGKPGHVPGQWASLQDAVAWINGAGGMAVIAHPARYRLTATRLRALIAEFKAAGGVGIEVVSGSHNKDEQLTLARLSQQQALFASIGSDYHGPENAWIHLGKLPDLPEACEAIWQHPRWPG